MRTPKVEWQADKPHLHLYALTEPLWQSQVWLPRILNGRVTTCTQSDGSLSSKPLAPSSAQRISPSQSSSPSLSLQRCCFLSSGGIATLRLWMTGHFTIALLTVLHGNFHEHNTKMWDHSRRCRRTLTRISTSADARGKGVQKAGAGVCRSVDTLTQPYRYPSYQGLCHVIGRTVRSWQQACATEVSPQSFHDMHSQPSTHARQL
jgi:hypothetical protein